MMWVLVCGACAMKERVRREGEARVRRSKRFDRAGSDSFWGVEAEEEGDEEEGTSDKNKWEIRRKWGGVACSFFKRRGRWSLGDETDMERV
jgi:hypothetical protein